MKIATILLVAVLVEAITEWLKLSVPKLDDNTPWIYAVTAVIGIGVCFGTGAGILSAMGVSCPFWLDYIMSGIIVSRGSNYVHDLMNRLTKVKEPEYEVYGIEEQHIEPTDAEALG